MLPKKQYSLRDKFAGIEPDRVKIAKVGKKKKVGAVRRTVAKIINKVTDKEV